MPQPENSAAYRASGSRRASRRLIVASSRNSAIAPPRSPASKAVMPPPITRVRRAVGPRGSAAGDERAQRAGLVLDFVEPALDQVADADDSAQPAVAHDREVPDPAVGHLGHQIGDPVLRGTG